MSPYHQIQDERSAANDAFDARIKQLQESCPHKDLTGWLQGYDHDGRLCKRCYKEVEDRRGGLHPLGF